MAPRIGIVADDLTGAADTGVAFLADDISVVVCWPDRARQARRVLQSGWLSPVADALAVDTRSRAASAEFARDVTADVVTVFRESGTATLYKKIDSTLRGHVGVEVLAAINSWHPRSIAVVAPAFPAAGRTTIDGRQHVGGVPMPEGAHVPALLDRVGIVTSHADLDHVRGDRLGSLLLACEHETPAALVCDAETDQDLRAIARAGARSGSPIVWVGSGGLAHALAAGTARSVSPPQVTASKPLLVVVGSTSDVARAQADDVAAAGTWRMTVPVTTVGGSTPAVAAFAEEVAAHLRAGDDVLVTIGAKADRESRDEPVLTARLGRLLSPCMTLVGGLILTGGDTAIGILQAWGAVGIRLAGELEPGVVLAETVGTRSIPVVTKAGSFGERTTLTRLLQRLHAGELGR